MVGVVGVVVVVVVSWVAEDEQKKYNCCERILASLTYLSRYNTHHLMHSLEGRLF